MKKNRIRIKYVGAVAAALLAAAPIAATAVTQIAGPAVAQADTPEVSADYQRGQEAGAADAAAMNNFTSPAGESDDFNNGYSMGYATYYSGFSAAVNKVLGYTPTIGQDEITQRGYYKGLTFVSSLESEIHDKQAQLNRGGWERKSDDAVRDALRTAEQAISTASMNMPTSQGGGLDPLNALKSADSKLRAAVLTPRSTPYDPNNPQEKAAEQASGEKAGQADSGAAITHADNTNESSDYQTAYDDAFSGTSGKTDGEQAANAFKDIPASFPGKSEQYITAFKTAIKEATVGIRDGTMAALAGKPDNSGHPDDSSYSHGYEPAYLVVSTNLARAKTGDSQGVNDARANSPLALIEGDQAYNYAYYNAYNDYTSGFFNGASDTKRNTDSQINEPIVALAGANYITGYKEGYEKTTDAAKAALQQAIADAKAAINSGRYQNNANMDELKTLVQNGSNVPANAHAGTLNQNASAIRNAVSQLTTNSSVPTTNPAPEFSYADGFQKDPTLTQGASFDSNSGISAWTDSSHSTAISASNWQVSGSVDTSKPGTYTLTYTITNSYGRTATLTRTITVKAAGTLTESSASGVVYVTTAAGADLFSDNATSNALGRNLANGTAWKVFGIVKDANGDVVAYNLGGKQYVRAADVSTTPAETQKGIFTVHYPANAKWSIAVYNSNLQVLKLIKAGSSWQTFGTKTLGDGKSYFNLGGNQWVRTEYGSWIAK